MQNHKGKRTHDWKNKRRNFPNNKRNDRFPKSNEYRNTEQLSETEVGITKFVGDIKGTGGIIKARFSDFQVNEIDLEGNVAKLTDKNLPKLEKSLMGDIETSPTSFIPQNVWEDVKNLMQTKENRIIEFDITELTKENRKEIHDTVKRCFGSKVIASTVNKEEKKFITLKHAKFATNEDTQRCQWPKDLGQYVHFILYKESVDTSSACVKLAKTIGVKSAVFNYAGLKDKRAKTSQWISVRTIQPWKLAKSALKTRPALHIGNYTFKDAPLKLGDLKGNRFKIALRNITCEDSDIIEAVESLKNNGFLNYYGLQRFGNDKKVPTFLIGKNLLLGNFKEACELILHPKKSDDPESDVTRAKQIYKETHDAGKAYRVIKDDRGSVEGLLLQSLSKLQRNDYVTALESIPRNVRLLYIHSFQSLIWNKMVSQRVEKFGLKPIVGDFVVVKEGSKDVEETKCEENKEEGLETGESKISCEENKEEGLETDKELEDFRCEQEIKILTQEDLDNYDISDIVLPLPGYDVQYPEHLKNDYKELLEEHGLTLEMPKQKVKTYSLSGKYRRFFGKVEEFSWKIMRYTDPLKDLIYSDLDALRGFNEPQDESDGKYKALVLEFTLSSSAYATMVLREIMRTDTSTSSHVKLNDYHQSERDKTKKTNGEKIEQVVVGKVMEDLDVIGASSSSLLKDAKKLEDFKKNIFSMINEKRSNEDEEDLSSKKLKVDETS